MRRTGISAVILFSPLPSSLPLEHFAGFEIRELINEVSRRYAVTTLRAYSNYFRSSFGAMDEGTTRDSHLPGPKDEPSGRPLGTAMLAARPSSASGFSSACRLPVLERPPTLDAIDDPALLGALRIRGRPKSMSVATSMLGRPITSHLLPHPRPQREGCRPPRLAPSSPSSTPPLLPPLQYCSIKVTPSLL